MILLTLQHLNLIWFSISIFLFLFKLHEEIGYNYSQKTNLNLTVAYFGFPDVLEAKYFLSSLNQVLLFPEGFDEMKFVRF